MSVQENLTRLKNAVKKLELEQLEKFKLKYDTNPNLLRKKQEDEQMEFYKKDYELREKNRELYRQWLVSNPDLSPNEILERMKL